MKEILISTSVVIVCLALLVFSFLGSGKTPEAIAATTATTKVTALETATVDYPDANIITTDSGLQYFDIKEGEGDNPVIAQEVTVNYTGKLASGRVFDSSQGRGPFTFTIGVGQVIKGWDEGVMSMKPGGERRLIIPPELAYGDRGAGRVIPGGATLIFDVEFIEAK
jgi:peptidylprolyl isomerase